MKLPRRKYQVGPARIDVDQDASGWWVVESWYQIDRRGNQEECSERIGGPFATFLEAAAKLRSYD